MSFSSALDIASTGLTAQRLRMDVIMENMANLDTTRTEDGGAYKRKTVIFQERSSDVNFNDFLNESLSGVGQVGRGGGVIVSEIAVDQTQGDLRYDPDHPDADADGYVENSNVNSIEEMVNMISASRSYEAVITANNITKSMLTKTLDMASR